MGNRFNETRISKMKILVAGAAGFIGSHLCERLIADGYEVVGIDNLSMGVNKIPKFILENEKFRFYKVDILNIDEFDHIFHIHTFDAIFHLAANTDTGRNDSQVDIRNTFNTTLTILEKCKLYNIKQLIFSSSGTVYGDVKDILDEDYGALLPISYYAAAKLSSEAFISAYSAMCDMRVWVCRFANVTGEHATHGVILSFIDKIKANPKELLVLGDGTQTKAYMYVKDCLDAVIYVWKNAKNRLNYFNISGGGTTSVKEIAEMVVKKMGMGTKIVYKGGERGWLGDVPQYYPTVKKLYSLGWVSKRDSNQAVEYAIDRIYEEVC